MTRHEIHALDFIRERIATTGCAPTLEEIAANAGWSAKSGAHRLVECLVRQGALVREPHVPRGLRLADVPVLTAVPTDVLLGELARRQVVVL